MGGALDRQGHGLSLFAFEDVTDLYAKDTTNLLGLDYINPSIIGFNLAVDGSSHAQSVGNVLLGETTRFPVLHELIDHRSIGWLVGVLHPRSV